jgi:exopolysaccharide biosynthesis polyprenyl glycosylphosphotransferase
LTAVLGDLGEPGQLLAPLALLLASLPVWLALSRAYELDDADVKQTSNTVADEAARLFHPVIVGAILLYLGAQLPGVSLTPLTIGLFCGLALPALAIARACARAVMRRRAIYVQNAVIVGAGRTAQLVASKLMHSCRGINVVGFVDAEPTPLSHELVGAPFLGDLETLPTTVKLLDVERVIVAFSSDSNEALLALVRKLDDVGVQVDIVPRLFEAVGPRAQLHELSGLPLVGLPPLRLSDASIASKRLLDFVGSAMLLVALAPLLAGIALTIKLTSPGPVFYRGARIGRNGTRFKLFKFRTMRIEHCRGPEYGGEDAEAAFRELMSDPANREQFERAHKLARDPRVTRVGELLRRSSLDELPQLLNVVKGDLALVGPRPITADEYDELVDSSTVGGYWTIPDLRPGVTGYWQINGRSSTTYEERVRLDTAYATSWSFRLDLLILARTGSALLDRRNAC